MTTHTSPRLPSVADLADHAIAINFALDHLEPFEVSEFLRERREGQNLAPWVEGVEQSKATAPGR